MHVARDAHPWCPRPPRQASLHHPNLVRYHDGFIEQDKYLCAVMDLLPAGDLEGVIRCGRGGLPGVTWPLLLGCLGTDLHNGSSAFVTACALCPVAPDGRQPSTQRAFAHT